MAFVWNRIKRWAYGAAWVGPLLVNATIVNIDFNGDRYVPGPNERPVTYQGPGAVSGGTYWNGVSVDSRLPGETDNDNLTVGGTNLLDSFGGATTVSFTVSPVGGDSTAFRTGQNYDDPSLTVALFSDYLFNNSADNHAGESPFTLSGLGNAATVDLYFYCTSGGVLISGQSPGSFAGSGAFDSANTIYFKAVPVNAGSVQGTFGSGIAVIGGMTIVGDFSVVPVPIEIIVQPTNQTVLEGTSATFEIQVRNAGLVTYQWQRNRVDIPGAVNSIYKISGVSGANQGDRFRCWITNTIGSVASAEAVLTVIPDTTPPTLREVQNNGTGSVRVIFSEPVDPATATNPENYRLSDGVTVSRAAFDTDSQTVVLTTSLLTYGSAYTLTVSNVRDLAFTPNSVPANSQYSFAVTDYLSKVIGTADPTASLTADTNGFTLSARGGEIGGLTDQFLFGYQSRSGDFDVQARISSFAVSDSWAKAGLMARENLNANSRFAAILATPSVAGSVFVSRATQGTASVASGSFPVNYPYTWLRLQRAGNVFNGYSSWDGSLWSKLGSVTLTLSNTVYFGMAVTSHSSSQSTTVQFQDLKNAVGGAVGTPFLPREPLIACSRRTGLVISEIMYHPGARADGRDLEFVELFNSQPYFQDLSGYRISGDIDYTFPVNTTLPGGAFLVLAKNPADVRAVYPIANVMGPYANRLSHRAGTLRLRNPQDSILLEVLYDSQLPWPCSADGAGHSLVLTRPSYGEGDPAAWAASDQIGGSPGLHDGTGPEPLRAVVINEFLARGQEGTPDFIELYNHSNQAVDLSGSFLSDDARALKFRIPPGTSLPGRGFVSFDQNQLGFGLNAGGEIIYLVNSNRTRVIDSVKFEAQAVGVSTGRFPDGATAFRELAAPTPNGANSALLIPDIAINEIMYHPVSENRDDEYVELYNSSSNGVDLSFWKLAGAVQFTFPTNISIAAGGYLVIARNLTNLLANYSNLNDNNTVGNYDGTFSDRGESLVLSRPDWDGLAGGNLGAATHSNYVLVTEVNYGPGGRWGKWADGGGSSLELIVPRSDPQRASNWADSEESSKTTNWTTIEFTGILDLGNSSYSADSLHILLLGAGECLIDNVEARAGTNGPNLIANSTFESGVSGWFIQGNHALSSLETNGGFNSARSLHIRTSGDGDTGGNRLRTQLTTRLNTGTTATLRAKVRWLRGCREIVLRLHGNWLEATGSMPVPINLGTPGARNSRATLNAGPAIYEVTHTPVLPAAKENVVVTARVHDPDGAGSVKLFYRLDTASTFTGVNMVDDGTGGDAVAADGIYSAVVPGQAANVLVAFYVQATDLASPAASTKFPDDAPARECLIRFGDPQPVSSFGTYRLWITQAKLNQWRNRERLSTLPIDATFVMGNQRVIYNVGAYYTGSPYKAAGFDSPIGSWCDYAFLFPPDDRFLGVTSLRICYPGNMNDEATIQREQASYWIADQLGLNYNYRRYVNLYVLGVKRGTIMEDTQLPGADFIQECYPEDTEGDLFKISLWFEFDDSNAGSFTPTPATLQKFTTTGGVKKMARYRWSWSKHAVKGSANNYTNFFALVDAVNGTGTNYTDQVLNLVDVDEWMRIFAVEHIVGNWDSIGYRNGSNMFTYKTRAGRWQLLIWDMDIGLRADYGIPPTSDLFEAGDPTIGRMFNHPPFRRIYFQALQDAANGPLLNTRSDPLLDAKYAALQANGISAASPAPIKTYIRDRRNYILSLLSTVAANFALNGPATFNTNRELIKLTGTAPIGVKTIAVNGIAPPLTWTSVTAWSMLLPLQSGTNVFSVMGYDRRNQWVVGASNQVTIVYTNSLVDPASSVVINEWMAGNTAAWPDPADGACDGWFELYNPSSKAVDLTGWFLTGFLSRPKEWPIPSGTRILPKGFLLVWADSQTNQNGFNADLHARFKLDPNGGAIGLAGPDGQWIDTIIFGSQTNNVSQGRFPDARFSPFYFMTTSTPRTTNTLAVANPPLSFSHIGLSPAGEFSLVWLASPGKIYRVEYKDALNAAAWTVLQGPFPATSSVMMFSDPSGPNAQRFYRIVRIDGVGSSSP